ncbi:GDSL-type esterase/lipase family protein [Caproiciproducens galactitolivorans]|uniref:GDSL-type esterase/lipase family protein n=1 Tax=Caproiciproducens galactitolivorans TaxID=642589 RepID=UPI0024098D40|nr:GDSL-type esterase/lipase family protein [Caproiciproducens galactitolivorans]
MNKNTITKSSLALLAVCSLLLSGCKQNNTSGGAKPEGSSSAPQSVSSTVSSEQEISQQTSSFHNSAGSEAQSEKVEESYLDDAVFIGDSVTLKLKNYVTIKRKSNPGYFGKAQFLAAGSMGSGNALKPLKSDSIHPSYNGKKALLEDSVAAMGAKKVYIMLGANDLGLYGVDKSAENMAKLLEKIKAKSPDTKIFVQSATPILKERQMKNLNNSNLVAYDNKLKELCKQRGYYFIDVASVMRDKEGNLPKEYCSDPDDLGIHFTDKACQVWIDYILTHVVK